MPEVSKTTHEITRYTLDLSAEEFGTFYSALAGHAGPVANRLRLAMREALDAKTELPRTLADGDRLRITGDGAGCTSSVTEDGGGIFQRGDTVTVLDAMPDRDGDMRVKDKDGHIWFLAASGHRAQWERVARRQIAKGDDVHLLKAVGSYTAGRLLKVQEDPNRYGNFAARAPFNSTALLSEDSEGDVWVRVGTDG